MHHEQSGMVTMVGAQAAIDRFHQDGQYFDGHYEELLRQYPEQWVAILDEQVVGADLDFEGLLRILEEKNLPLEQTFIDRVTAQTDVLILRG